MNGLEIPEVKGTLERLHGKARRHMPAIARGFLRTFGREVEPHDMVDAYIAISANQGRLLYGLCCAVRARAIIKFGAFVTDDERARPEARLKQSHA